MGFIKHFADSGEGEKWPPEHLICETCKFNLPTSGRPCIVEKECKKGNFFMWEKKDE